MITQATPATRACYQLRCSVCLERTPSMFVSCLLPPSLRSQLLHSTGCLSSVSSQELSLCLPFSTASCKATIDGSPSLDKLARPHPHALMKSATVTKYSLSSFDGTMKRTNCHCFHVLHDQHCASLLASLRRKAIVHHKRVQSFLINCCVSEVLHRDSWTSHTRNTPASVLCVRRFMLFSLFSAGLLWMRWFLPCLRLARLDFLARTPSLLPAPRRPRPE